VTRLARKKKPQTRSCGLVVSGGWTGGRPTGMRLAYR
jgi:hypothetical protein